MHAGSLTGPDAALPLAHGLPSCRGPAAVSQTKAGLLLASLQCLAESPRRCVKRAGVCGAHTCTSMTCMHMVRIKSTQTHWFRLLLASPHNSRSTHNHGFVSFTRSHLFVTLLHFPEQQLPCVQDSPGSAQPVGGEVKACKHRKVRSLVATAEDTLGACRCSRKLWHMPTWQACRVPASHSQRLVSRVLTRD